MPEPTEAPNPYAVTFTMDMAQLALDTNYRAVPSYSDPDEPDYVPTGNVTLLDLVVREGARQLVAQADKDTRSGLRLMAQEMLKAEIGRQATELVAAALATDIRSTDEFGYDRTPPKPLAAHIVDTARTYLRTSTDSYRKTTPLDAFLEAEVKRTFSTELDGELKAAKAQVRGAVTALVADKLGALAPDLVKP